MKRIFFSVGEPSGDQHAAELITELQQRDSELVCCGYGGPHMQEAGCRLDFELTRMAVMGLLRVLPLIRRFYQLVKQAEQIFRENPPDAVVLVDFPGFNWWIARKAKRAGIPVFYYLPPQLWAWAPWRIRKMKKFVDHVLCGLPFEPDWYAKRGMQVDYVGHPFFDEVATHPLDETFLASYDGQTIVGILPGSRGHEVTKNFPYQVQLMQKMAAENPNLTFLVAGYKPSQKDWCEEYLNQQHLTLNVEFHTGKTSEIIERAEFCLMVSGSVSLEMLARKTPAVVIYTCGRVAAWSARNLLTISSITLPNLIAGRNVLPEFLLYGNQPKNLSAAQSVLCDWVKNPDSLNAVREELEVLHAKIGEPGASTRVAELILARMSSGETSEEQPLPEKLPSAA